MSEFSHNLAVVIGINQYGSGIAPLQTAVNDVQELARILQDDHGYQVVQLVDQQASLKALQHLLDKELPQRVQADSRLLFYFAGHGIALNGDEGPEGYLIPQDAKLGDISSYLSMPKLQAALSELPCRHFLGILDCCFAGAFRWSSTRDLLSVPDVIHKERYDRFVQDPAWQTITSAASDQKALDSLTVNSERGQTGNHSPFAAALLDALAGKADVYPPAKNGKPAGDGVTTATELYLYLRDRVEPATEGNRQRQTPGIWPLKRHDKGEYIFLSPGHVLNLPPAPPLDESKNPYRGLQSFEAEQSSLFFGRQALTEKLGEFVSRQPLSVVLGASGSGKSSLVKAGLIPDLKRDAKADHHQWQILAPMRPGESPFKALNNTLAGEMGSAVLMPAPGSESEVEMLTQYMAAWSQQHPGMKLLLAIDQFEELITLCRNDKERAQFIQGLAQAVSTYPEQLRLVLTLRSDFEPQFQDAALKQHWTQARFVIPPMTRSELREAIEEPASQRVMYFQSDDPKNPLVDQLINEVAEMPGALPLLSFTLSELYLKYLRRQKIAENRGDRIDRSITEADYKQLGGVARSLTQRADQEYEALVRQDPSYEQTIRNVMLRMVAVGGGELARRKVPLSEFEYPPAQNDRVKEVIRHFSAARLVVEGKDPDGKPYAEPAHDALVRGWQKLLTWKQEEEESLILQRRLTPAAEEWKDIAAKKQPEGVLAKAEPVIDWFDRRFYAAESLLSKASVQVIRKWKRSQQKERSRETSAQFLWTTNPYLDVLNQQLQFANSWFNQAESDFVQKSVLQRRKNTSWRWRIAIGVMVGLSGLTIAALIGQRNAQIGQTTASRASAEANFRTNEQLNALVDSLRAGKGIKQILFPANDLNNQVEQTLRSMVYSAKESNRWEAPPGVVFSMFFAGDRQLRVITNDDGIVRLWGIDGKQLAELQGQEGLFVGGISVSSDGSRIATATKDGTVHLWNLQGEKLNEFPAYKCQINESWQTCIDRIGFSPDGSKVAIVEASNNGQNQSIRIWNLGDNTFEEIPIEASGNVAGIGFSSNNELLVAINSGGCLRVSKWSGGQTQDLACGDIVGSPMEARFSPDGKRAMIFYGEESENAVLWNFLEGGEPQSINNQERISSGGTFSLDGKQLAATGVDGTVDLLLGDDGWTTLKLPQGRVRHSTFSPDGRQLVTLGDDNTIRLWDLEQQPLSKSTLLQAGIESISFSLSHQMLATTDSAGTVRLLDWQGNPVKEFAGLPKTTSISFSPNGRTLATTGENGIVRLLDLQGKLLEEFPAHPGNITSVIWSQDGERIATIGDGGDNDPATNQSVENSLIRLWDTQGNLLEEHKGSWIFPFESVGFQADGQLIMVAQGQEISYTGNIYLLDSLGRSTNIIPGRQAGDVFNLVKLSSDGRFLLTATTSTIVFWNLNGEKIIEFPGTAKNLSLSSDNSVLAVTSGDGSTELWQWEILMNCS
ncbi:MAG: hypothetical protein HC895_14565 [Leptolyngbyaceae cyanobacterium SM1_3_5]|nr:hypothetical protein [Leptolyngbyaceae cyanobacterium SM1_3_5]